MPYRKRDNEGDCAGFPLRGDLGDFEAHPPRLGKLRRVNREENFAEYHIPFILKERVA